jgi:hypothetical protein
MVSGFRCQVSGFNFRVPFALTPHVKLQFFSIKLAARRLAAGVNSEPQNQNIQPQNFEG